MTKYPHCDKRNRLCLYITFLPNWAPDGDNKDTDDGENQKGQNHGDRLIRYCTLRIYDCTGICENKGVKRSASAEGWISFEEKCGDNGREGCGQRHWDEETDGSKMKAGEIKGKQKGRIKTAEWECVQGARLGRGEFDIFRPTCIITFHHPPVNRMPDSLNGWEKGGKARGVNKEIRMSTSTDTTSKHLARAQCIWNEGNFVFTSTSPKKWSTTDKKSNRKGRRNFVTICRQNYRSRKSFVPNPTL